MRADDILNQIDDALEDWTVSDDAMRSRPGGEQSETAEPRLWIAPLGTGPDASGWQEAGYITSVDLHIDQATIDPAALTTPQPTVTWEEIVDYFNQIQAERAR